MPCLKPQQLTFSQCKSQAVGIKSPLCFCLASYVSSPYVSFPSELCVVAASHYMGSFSPFHGAAVCLFLPPCLPPSFILLYGVGVGGLPAHFGLISISINTLSHHLPPQETIPLFFPYIFFHLFIYLLICIMCTCFCGHTD